MDRFVFDTGVLVSAAMMPQSLPRQAFDLAVSIGSIVTSKETIAEFAEVIGRDKFGRYAPLSLRQAFVDEFAVAAELIDVTVEIAVCRDPTDDMFLALAVASGARTIVTSDEDLLVLNPFEGISIETPRTFVDHRKIPA